MSELEVSLKNKNPTLRMWGKRTPHLGCGEIPHKTMIRDANVSQTRYKMTHSSSNMSKTRRKMTLLTLNVTKTPRKITLLAYTMS